MEREFLATDVEGIEGIGAVFEQVFLGLDELFAQLILADHEVARPQRSNPLRLLETLAD